MKRYYLAAVGLVLVALAAGLANSIVAKPYVSDRIIAQDFITVSSAVQKYHSTNHKLPDSLIQLKFTGDINLRLKNYEYTPGSAVVSADTKSENSRMSYRPDMINPITYTLCATFKTSTFDDNTKMAPAGFNPQTHDKGRQCFTDNAAGTEPVTDRSQ